MTAKPSVLASAPDALESAEPPRLGDRPLCFLHIAKTGGTSVTDALARLFPPDCVFTDRGNLSVDYLEELGDRLTGRVFLAGHPLPGVAESLRDRADLITVLRRPADQAVSNYLHILSDPGNGLHSEAVRGSFSDFLRRNEHQIDYQTSALVVALSQDPTRMHELRTRDLESVLQFLDAMPFVGVMERADACGEILSRIMPGAGEITLPCLNAAVYRGISVRTLDRLRLEYEALSGDSQLAPIFAREALVHARADAALARLERRLALPRRSSAPLTRRETIGAARFSTRHGEFADQTIVCRLLPGPEHLLHGPYDRFPRGAYAVEFQFSVAGAKTGSAGRIQLEVSSNGATSLRRRWTSPAASAQARTLHFMNGAASNILEFRVKARGFTDGRLVFEGVAVRPSTIWRSWPSVLTRLFSRTRRGPIPHTGARETGAAIPIEARARSLTVGRAQPPTIT